MKSKIIKKTLRVLLAVFLFLLIILMSSYIAIRTSYVQTRLAQYAAGILSEQLNSKIEVKGVDVAFFTSVILEGVYVEDQHQDTLFYTEKLRLNIRDIDRKNHHLHLREAKLDNLDFFLKTYKDESDLNIQFIIDAFQSKDTSSTAPPQWTVDADRLKITSGHFILDNANKDTLDFGMDYDHLDVNQIELSIGDINITGDTIAGRINKLSAVERSGFVLNELSADARVSPMFTEAKQLAVHTPNSHIYTDLRFDHDGWDTYLRFIEEMDMHLDIRESDLSFKDISYYAPDLEGLNTKISIIGDIRGTVDNLKGKDVDFIFGYDTHFEGNVNLSGLPDVEHTLIHLTVKDLTTSRKDLVMIPLPPFNEKNFLEIPENIGYLGEIGFKGDFTGFYNDFVAYGKFRTALGNLASDLSMKQGKGKQPIAYKGYLKMDRFNVGKLFEIDEYLGYVTMEANLDGAGVELETIKANMVGTINSIELVDYEYKNIEIKGDFAENVFDGNLSIDEKNVKLDFNGMVDFTGELPHFDFVSNIEHANLTALKLMDDSTDILVSAKIELDYIGKGIDEGTGSASLSNLNYKDGENEYEVKNLNLLITEGGGSKLLRLESDIADADIIGNFKFADLPVAVSRLVLNYLPSYRPKNLKELAMDDQMFDFKVELKETGLITHLFAPYIDVTPGGKLRGTFHSSQGDFFLTGEIPEVNIKKTKVEKLKIISTTNAGILDLSVNAGKVWASDSIFFENIRVGTRTYSDTSHVDIDWKNASAASNRGRVNAVVSFVKGTNVYVQFKPSEIWVQDSLWVIDSNNSIEIDSNSYAINNLQFRHESQKIRVSGKISENPEDELEIFFNDFELANFNPLTTTKGFNISGKISGNALASNLYGKPSFLANLNFIKLVANAEELGDGTISGKWDTGKDGIQMKGKFMRGPIPTIGFDGYYYANREKDNFDFNISLEKTKLKIFDPYINNIVSKVYGDATGELRLEGSPAEPILTGELNLQKVNFMVDYLNSSFSFTDKVTLTKDAIVFENLLVNDFLDPTKSDDRRIMRSRPVNEGKGVINGKIYHDHFSNFRFDLNLDARNMQFLNTTASMNSLYYGRAFATGLIRFTGTPSNIEIDIAAKTERHTEFNIPLYGADETSISNYITFVNSNKKTKEDQIKAEKQEVSDDEYQVDLSSIKLNFDLEVTPDAEVQLIFDPAIGDIIKGRGNGDIKLEINTIGDFKMYGDYIIDGGDYLFTLQNVINKKFIIQQGGTIKWSGDPYDAYIDLVAIYPVRTNLYDLMHYEGMSNDEIAKYRKRIQVNCEMTMTGKLMNPNIEFDIELPSSDATIVTDVKAQIRTEEDMNRQIFALLLMRRFIQPGNNGLSGSSALSSNSTELLSNQLSNWLSQISNDVDIGVNYSAGNDRTTPTDTDGGEEPDDGNSYYQQVELALSTQLFNNRVVVDGNVGVANTNAKGSDIVGDFNVEYKITEDGRLRVRAFNETNDLNNLAISAPFTQGVGLSYRKEFDTFGDLWRSIIKKRNAAKKEEEPEIKEEEPPVNNEAQ